MRTTDLLEEYMNKPYRYEIVEDKDEGGYVVSFPDLQGCITCGETIESAIANANDAKKEWLTAMIEENQPIPEPFNAEEYSGNFRIRMPKSLHKMLAERSKEEGISMNQYCIYLLSKIS